MCGLFGVVSKELGKEEIRGVEFLGLTSMLRGIHSAGVIVGHKIPKKKPPHYEIFKAMGPSINLLSFEPVVNIFKGKTKKQLVLGHTRQATSGDKDLQNAHPHRFEHILGAHNGTIAKFGHGREFLQHGSDSRVFFHKIANLGLDLAVEEAGFSAAYALSFVNQCNNSLNFLRNEERPLWFMENEASDTYFWASEEAMLKFLVPRLEQKFADPWELEVDTLFTINIENPQETSIRKVVGPKAAPVHSQAWSIEDWRAAHNQKEEEKKEAYKNSWAELLDQAYKEDLDRSDAQEKIEEKRSIIQLTDRTKTDPTKDFYYQGWKGDVCTIEDVSEFLSMGCSFCGDPQDVSSPVSWISQDEFVCDDCFNRQDYLRIYHHPGGGRSYHGVIVELTEFEFKIKRKWRPSHTQVLPGMGRIN